MNKPTYILRSVEAEEARKAELDALRYKTTAQQDLIDNMRECSEFASLNRKTQSRRDVEASVAAALRYRDQVADQRIKARQWLIVLAALLIAALISIWTLCSCGLIAADVARLGGDLLTAVVAWKSGTLWHTAWDD